MTDYDKIYINGRWVASEGKATIAVHDSLTEQVMATIPEGTADDVAKAAAAAKAAFESWSTLPAAERAKYMSRIGDALAGRMDEDRKSTCLNSSHSSVSRMPSSA